MKTENSSAPVLLAEEQSCKWPIRNCANDQTHVVIILAWFGLHFPLYATREMMCMPITWMDMDHSGVSCWMVRVPHLSSESSHCQLSTLHSNWSHLQCCSVVMGRSMSTTHPQPFPLIRAAWSQESQDLDATAGLSLSQESAALKERFEF